MNEIHILIRLLRMYIPRNWEIGSALAKLRNFGRERGQTPPFGMPLVGSNATAVLALRVAGTHKLLHSDNLEIPSEDPL
jgi:hypothetical protein